MSSRRCEPSKIQKDYFSTERNKEKSNVHTGDQIELGKKRRQKHKNSDFSTLQEYQTEKNYKSVDRKRAKKAKKRISSKKRHESSKHRLANKRELSIKENNADNRKHMMQPQLKEVLETTNSDCEVPSTYWKWNNLPDEDTHSSQIYTFNELTCTSKGNSERQNITGDEKRILVQKSINFKHNGVHKVKLIKGCQDISSECKSISPRTIRNIKTIGKENKNENNVFSKYEHSKDVSKTWKPNNDYSIKNSFTQREDHSDIRRSNPVGNFYQEKSENYDNTISETSNTHLSKSEINFHKPAAKKRFSRRRKTSKTKIPDQYEHISPSSQKQVNPVEWKSTREGEYRSQNITVYGRNKDENLTNSCSKSNISSGQDKRKSQTRREGKADDSHYREKYYRLKKRYEHETKLLNQKIEVVKQAHYKQIFELKVQLEESLTSLARLKTDRSTEWCLTRCLENDSVSESALKYLSEINQCNSCGKSLSQSMFDDRSISSTFTENNSTMKHDSKILRSKEDNIWSLIQELKGSDQNINSQKSSMKNVSSKFEKASSKINSQNQQFSEMESGSYETKDSVPKQQKKVISEGCVGFPVSRITEQTPEFHGARNHAGQY